MVCSTDGLPEVDIRGTCNILDGIPRRRLTDVSLRV